jgi:cell fate regulator YaaT (PSP1 superfamily)
VSLTGELVRLQLKKKNISEFGIDMKKILRLSNDKDLELMEKNKSREKEALITSRIIAKNLNLDMKLIEVEIQADGKKGTFFYTADDRGRFQRTDQTICCRVQVKDRNAAGGYPPRVPQKLVA